MKEFYLISTELELPYEPRLCRVHKRLQSDTRDDIALVEVDPPIHREIYSTENDISEVILASRLEHSSLFPISEWPTYVYICLLAKEASMNSGRIEDKDFSIIDWGEIHRTKENAIRAIKS